MKRIRVEKNKNYTTISNVFLRDERLSLKAKGFLAMIMSLKDDWDFTIEGFVNITKEGEAAIYTAIKELKDFGYCKEEKIRDEKKRIVGNEYTFYEEPKTQSADNQLDCENQDLGFLNQANQGQISTTNNNTNNKVLNEIKEKEDNKLSSKKKVNNQDVLAQYDINDVPSEFVDVVRDWCQYKRERKERYKTQSSFMAMVKRLIKLSSNNVDKAKEIIEQSIANNYAGLFELKQRSNNNPIGFILEKGREEKYKKNSGKNW